MIINKKIVLGIILLTAALTAVSYLLFCKKIGIEEPTSKIFLASIYNDAKTYEDIFAKLPQNTEKNVVKAGIISHHFLAKDLIAEFYNKIGNENTSTIFLVSPDHYNHFFASGVLAYTSKANWKTPFGDLETNQKVINSLTKEGSVEIDDSMLGLEHGIYTEIPFIKKFFPNAKIVPLVVDLYSDYSDFKALGNEINGLADKDAILIVSSDFSHNLASDEALIKDKTSINSLRSLTSENINKVTSDCKQCLSVLSGFFGDEKYRFNLIDNKNSFDISSEDKNSVTSYVSGFYTEKKDIQILFTGDLMFDRGIRYYADKNGSNEYIFEKIYTTLSNNDLVVSNLEGPITDNPSTSAGTAPGSEKNYSFTFDKSVAKTLFLQNIKLVSLANNHTLNFHTAGLKSTEKYLSEAGVEYFGSPEGNKSIIKEIDGVKIAFVAYNEFYGDSSTEQIKTIEEIKKLKKEADLVIVFSHWGVEYSVIPVDSVKNLAHQFVDAGADLIIGSHPHIIEPLETYNGKRIYYSLGNFIFDQYFNENVRNGRGVIVKINPETKELEFKELNFYLQSGGQTIIKN
jgi:AmmeMemoRadiSam system protein B